MELREWAKARRLKKDLTLSQAAELIGCTKSYVHDFESGRYTPSIDRAEAIANAYGSKLSNALRACGK